MGGRDEGREDVLNPAEFPRSAAYDPGWVLENMMGPNALWLTESLAGRISLNPGMRVLDLGCGKGLSSIFLAKEYGVQVWATDLWIDASENFGRICEAGVEDRVFPIHAEAHALPFADGFFDAMVSVDAYHYFGTDDLYLENHLARLVKSGGQMGIVVPGLVEELPSAEAPEHLREYWEPAMFSLHSPEWWQTALGAKRVGGRGAFRPDSRGVEAVDGIGLGCGQNTWESPPTKRICWRWIADGRWGSPAWLAGGITGRHRVWTKSKLRPEWDVGIDPTWAALAPSRETV